MKREKQVNIRFSEDEFKDVDRRAKERKQKVPELLRDLLRFGMLPEVESRR